MKPILLHFSGAVALSFTLAACIPAVDVPVTSSPGPQAQAPASGQTPQPAAAGTSQTAATIAGAQPPRAAPAPAQPARLEEMPDNWMDQPRTPGDWRYRKTSDGGIADYIGTDGRTLFQLDCTPEIGVLLSVAGTNFNASSIQIWTETANRALAADAREGWVQAVVRPQDSLLDAMAVTKGNFAVRSAGLPPLYLPGWAEVTRVIEDCR